MGTKSALAFLALVSLTMFPVNAQPQSTSTGGQQKTGTGIKPVSAAEFSRQFREGFLKGCLNGKTEGVRNQTSYCNCLAGAYQSRYDGKTLAAISQLAGRSGGAGPSLVNLMIAPEAKTCASKN